MSNLALHADWSLDQHESARDQIVRISDWLNSQTGRVMTPNQGEQGLALALAYKEQIKLIKLDGQERRADIVNAVKALTNCYKKL